MKLTKRILTSVLAVVLMLSVLTGCSLPKLFIGGTPKVAATVAGQEISTGEYLAYLYNTLNTVYNNNGLYYYAAYGMDPWTQEFTYGEGDDAQKVKLSEFITLQTKDAIVRQVALTQLLEKHGLSWLAEDEKEIDEELKNMSNDDFISLGFTYDKFVKCYKALGLNERSLFMGLYGEGGEREVKTEELQQYYDKNYVAYKMISIALTDDEGKELDEAGKKKITDRLDGYLATYNKDKNFEAVMDAYKKEEATDKDAKLEATKDEDNRQITDAKNLDTDLLEAIRSVEIGTAKVVTYKDGGKTPTAALIVRLDPNEKEQFKEHKEEVLITMKYEEFDEEVTKAAQALTAEFNATVVKKCKPEAFVEATA